MIAVSAKTSNIMNPPNFSPVFESPKATPELLLTLSDSLTTNPACHTLLLESYTPRGREGTVVTRKPAWSCLGLGD